MVIRFAIAICMLALAASLRADVPLVFEAESAVRLKGVFEFARGPAMGGELGLQVREGVGTDFDENQAGQLQRKNPGVDFDADGGQAVYRFHVPEAGNYWVWARAYWLWECSNSFWVGEAPDSSTILTDKIYHRWHWVRAEEAVRLAAGTAPFTISNREDGIRIDQFCLTRDRHFRPRGILETNALVPRAETPPPLFLYPVAQAPMVLAESETRVVLWIRNAAGHRRTVTVSAEHDETLAVTAPEGLTMELPARSGLAGVPFGVKARTGRPFQRSQVRFSAGEKSQDPVTVRQDFVHAPPWEAAGPFRHRPAGAVHPQGWWGVNQQAPAAGLLRALRWVPIDEPELLTGAGRIDFRRVLGEGRGACWAYVRAEFDWPQDESFPVELRSDDQSTVWVNGAFAAAHRVIGPGERYYTRCTLPFKRGSNTILIAVNQVRAFWECSLMPARDANAEPATSLANE